MAAPCALIGSCCDFEPKELVKQILNKDELADGPTVIENIQSYPWHVDTKYYTADINLCTTGSKTIGDEKFSESVQAIILYFDSRQESSFDLVKSWLPFVDQLEPNVQILVCESCSQNHVVPRSKVFEWCLEKQFELVELKPEELADEDDDEDEFKETVGIKRIIQALHSHTWSNLTMKENPSVHSQYFQKLKDEEAANMAAAQSVENGMSIPKPNETDTQKMSGASHICELANGVESLELKHSEIKDAKSQKSSENNKIDSLFGDDDITLLNSLGNEDGGEESFEVLFSRMREMKERANNLPPEQRKAYAEQVAISFWKAIGGDEDEIGNLDDSD